MIIKSKLFEAIDPCIRIFRFLCFADVSGSRNSSSRQKLSALLIVIKYLAMLGVLTYQVITSALENVNQLQDSGRLPVHQIIYFFTVIEGFISLLQSIFSSSKSARFMNRMKEVDELFLNALSVKIDYEDLRWTLLTKMSPLILYFIGSTVVTTMAMHQHYHLLRLGIYFHVPILLMRIFTQRFIFMVNLLTFYLNETVKVLETMMNTQPVLIRRDDIHTWRWNTRRNHLKLKVLQKIYRRLWDASCLVNESFGAGLVYIFFVQVLFAIYLGYTFCIDFSTNNVTYRQLVSISLTLYGILVIHYHCQQCLNSVIY